MLKDPTKEKFFDKKFLKDGLTEKSAIF